MAVPIAAAIWVAFSFIIVPMILRVLVSLGIGWVIYSGITELLEYISNTVQSHMGTFGPEILGFLGLLNIDRAITIVLSAVAIRATLNGMTGQGLLPKINWSPFGG